MVKDIPGPGEQKQITDAQINCIKLPFPCVFVHVMFVMLAYEKHFT